MRLTLQPTFLFSQQLINFPSQGQKLIAISSLAALLTEFHPALSLFACHGFPPDDR